MVAMRVWTPFWLAMFAIVAGSCSHRQPDVTRPSPDEPSLDWVVSPDSKLSLRLVALRTTLVAAAPLAVSVELRNDSLVEINVLRPHGDHYLADQVWLKIEGPDGMIKYTGPVASYTLGAESFLTMRPGQVIRDVIELPVGNFKGSDTPGRYTMTLNYQPSPSHRETAAQRWIDKKDLWIGQIQSKAVIIIKSK